MTRRALLAALGAVGVGGPVRGRRSVTGRRQRGQKQPAVYPGAEWESRDPPAVGVDPAKLDSLRELVGGSGCVVRSGYMVYVWGDPTRPVDVASAVKPVISHLLLNAVQDRLVRSVDDPVARFEPRLRDLNDGKDARITWRHLASQTSGYGLAERPGAVWAYNDYAIALYYDTLTTRVYRATGDALLDRLLATPLGFQDRHTFEAFGPQRPGRLALSPRDFARFGWLYLNRCLWGGEALLRPDLARLALGSPVPRALRRTSGVEAPMIAGQRSLGGGKNITPVGPGVYSFNWWLNRTDGFGRRLFVGAPDDLFVASGHGGKRAVWVIPSLDLVVSWNDARVDDHDASPGNPGTRCSQAARLMAESIGLRAR